MFRLAEIRSFPPSFQIILAGTFINRLGGFAIPFLAIYLTGPRGLSMEFAGLVTALVGIGSFAAGPLGGLLADRIGRRRTMMLSLCLGALCTLALGLARSQAAIAALGFLSALAGDLYRPASAAATADMMAQSRLPSAFRMLHWSANIGFAVASAVAGFLAAESFALLFVLDAATTLTYGAIVWRALPETRPTGRKRPGIRLDAPWREPSFIGLFLLTLVGQIVYLQAMTTLPIDMIAHGLSTVQYGYLASLNGVMVVVLQPLLAGIYGKWSPAVLLTSSTLLTAIGFGMNFWADSVSLYGLAVATWTMGELLGAGVAQGLVARIAPPELRGSFQGTLQMSVGAAAFLAPLAGTRVMAQLGAGWLWSGCFACCLIAAALTWPLVVRMEASHPARA